MKSKDYPREEEVAYPDEVRGGVPAEPEEEKVKDDVDDMCAEKEEMVHRFIVKQLDEFVRLQVMTSTLNGQKYLVIPTKYFTLMPEEVVLLDDAALIPFDDGYSKPE